ncbi:hypothetical protein RND71_042746 [Anisodus tanguticus]|uniref:Uncharacterized protein n=1 Tax=Anisodus tanguticus TaxID=243964 RepID=A0AAE1UV22_9SOLA|nr:hypothetical protein RND71_042746 [Anisodus tanguticus]
MPKSKHNRVVTLSKTKKKRNEHKENIVNSIRECAEKYCPVYVFSFKNMRNLKFKEFKDQLKSSSRFFLGLNKVMQEPQLTRRNRRRKVYDASLHVGGMSYLARTSEHPHDSPSASLDIRVSLVEAAEEEEVYITVEETAREDPSIEASPIDDSEASAEIIPEDVLL